MSDTPRTDEMIETAFAASGQWHDFARQLERELAASQSEVARLTNERDDWQACAERVDAKMLAEQADHNKTVDKLIACKAEVARLRGNLTRLVKLKDELVIQNRKNWEQQDAWRNRAISAEVEASAMRATLEQIAGNGNDWRFAANVARTVLSAGGQQ